MKPKAQFGPLIRTDIGAGPFADISVQKQRDWQTETGEKRSSFELNADDIGASVRYATVQITKANESAATPPAPQSQPNQSAQPVQQAKDDPWPNAGQDQFAEPQEPNF